MKIALNISLIFFSFGAIGQVSLPFFEDFSRSDIHVDTAKFDIWQNISISSTIANNPPTQNVAIFDALDGNGNPYTSSALSTGKADSLESIAIDLSEFDNSDNVFFSFYWQKQGLADFPELADSLILQFFSPDSLWISVWPTNPTDSITQSFRQEIIRIPDSLFHQHFKFKFQVYSRLSGAFDVWLLDYIFINTNRSINSTTYPDRSVSKVTGNIFRSNYSAIPYAHFAAEPSKYLDQNGLVWTITNLEGQLRPVEYAATITFNEFVTDTLVSTFNTVDVITFSDEARVVTPTHQSILWSQLDSLDQNLEVAIKFFIQNQDTAFSREGQQSFASNDTLFFENGIIILPQSINSLDSPRVFTTKIIADDMVALPDTLAFEEGIILTNTEEDVLFINGKKYLTGTAFWEDFDYPDFTARANQILPLANNDTLSETITIEDYYAYDDGSAEAIYVLNGSGALAYMFTLDRSYTLTGVEGYFPPTFGVNSTNSIDLIVWEDLEGGEIHRETQPLARAGAINSFTRFRFNEPIVVSDTFYIGWEQFGGRSTAVGFDRNQRNGDKIFFNVGGDWLPNTDAGSMMFRPVFEPINDTVGLVKPETYTIISWPNPAKSYFFVDGSFSSYKVADINGRLIISGRKDENQPVMIDCAYWPSGLYIIHTTNLAGEHSALRILKK